MAHPPPPVTTAERGSPSLVARLRDLDALLVSSQLFVRYTSIGGMCGMCIGRGVSTTMSLPWARRPR